MREHRFKVGDRVRHISPWAPYGDVVGTVTALNNASDGGPTVSIHWANGYTDGTGDRWYETALRLAENQPQHGVTCLCGDRRCPMIFDPPPHP